jgi:UDP-2,3-diacylglucosamine hydrolase
MSLFFISDLHLDASRPNCLTAFLKYLGDRKQGEELYILGDLFEVWIGDDHETALSRSVIKALAACPAEIYFMPGNRDFLIGVEFARATGITLIEEPHVILVNNERVLLLHGDSLCTRDEAYMRVRPMLRDPDFQKQLLMKPTEERLEIAGDARQKSQAHTSTTDLGIMDVTPQAVIDALIDNAATTLIHGHTHRPFDHRRVLSETTGRRIVLGDWDKLGWHIHLEDAALALNSFSI